MASLYSVLHFAAIDAGGGVFQEPRATAALATSLRDVQSRSSAGHGSGGRNTVTIYHV